jgi:hypothetical protein
MLTPGNTYVFIRHGDESTWVSTRKDARKELEHLIMEFGHSGIGTITAALILAKEYPEEHVYLAEPEPVYYDATEPKDYDEEIERILSALF